jgi:hypothetical protein
VKEACGDIWSWLDAPHHAEVVIPTNIGWKSNGENVMGAGLAKECLARYPGVAQWYGEICQACGPFTPVVVHPEHPLIFFPTKVLNYDEPHLSWQRGSHLGLIERATQQLAALRLGPVALPLVGCGNGGLSEERVLPVLRDWLGSSNHVTLVRRG